MKWHQYLTHYDELKPIVKQAFSEGVQLGLWTGGIIVFLMFTILYFVL